MARSDAYEAVIGLEVHAQLLTRSKIVCGCPNAFGAAPNHNVCPVCMGMPGVLPVFNRRVLELAIRVALATHSQIAPRSVFARKNYFYPDLPKGYQISQYEQPFCTGGYIELPNGGSSPRKIRLTRIHIEEDAGKNIHASGYSLVDLNRAGTPLLEIVSEPDLRSPEEAVAYLKELRAILRYLEVCDGNMEEGSFRCDANVSVRRRGESRLGVKTEIKNLNSFKFVEKALRHEIERQIEVLEAGGTITQETHLFDPERGITKPMRSKEYAHDYRYFPEPDLPPLEVPPSLIEAIKAQSPEVPSARRARYAQQYGLSSYEIEVLTQERDIGDYFEALVNHGVDRKMAANWTMTEVLRAVNESALPLSRAVPPAAETAALLKMVAGNEISLNGAKTAFAAMCKTGQSAVEAVNALGLTQVSDEAQIAEVCEQVLRAEADKVKEYRAGRQKLFGFFVGQVMKAMKGKANPKIVNEVLKRKLDS